MQAEQFYLPSLRPEFSQGDLVELCPAGALPSLRVARIWMGETGPEAKASVYDYPLPASGIRRPPTPPLFRREPDTPLFEARLQRCIVVSNDCVVIAKEDNRAMSLELDERKREWPWHVAPVHPWPHPSQTVPIHGESRPLGDLIEEGRIHRYLAVPEGPSISRCYVDFRFLTPLKPELFDRMTRSASITDLGQAYLWAKVYTYFSGRVFPNELSCPHCGGTFSLADVPSPGVDRQP